MEKPRGRPKRPYLMDARWVCKELNMSKSAFYSHLKHGPPKSRKGTIGVDIRQIPYIYVGLKRYWYRDDLDRIIGRR